MMTNLCPNGHPNSTKICLECGYVVPHKMGDTLAKGYSVQQVRANGQLNQYIVSKGSQQFVLWETKEFLKPDYRNQLFSQVTQRFKNCWPEIIEFWTMSQHITADLLYVVQSSQPYQEAYLLDDLIKEEGFLSPEQIKSVIYFLLNTLSQLEAQDYLFNAVTSQHIFLKGDEVFLNLPLYCEQLTDEKPTYLPFVHLGFSPPEQIRTGRLYYECDRFAVAMVLFHLLTGLSPVLWYPDVPKMSSYLYLWNKNVIEFFKKLLQPVHKYSIHELIQEWNYLELELKNPAKRAVCQQEIVKFYQAVEIFKKQTYSEALDLFLDIQQSELSNPHTDRYIAKILWKLGHKSEAFQAFGRADRREKLGGTYLEIGALYIEEGNLERAISSYYQALLLVPYITEPYNKLGQIAFRRDKFMEAQNLFKRSLEIKPNHEARDYLNQISQKLKSQSLSGHSLYATSYHKEKWKEEFQPEDNQMTCPEGHINQGLPAKCLFCKAPFVLSEGDTVKNYTIKKVLSPRLNQDVPTATYLVESPIHQGLLFLKEITIDKPTRKKRFENEVFWLNNLTHPSIPECIDSFEIHHKAYIVMPYYKGQSLLDMLNEVNFFSEKYVRIFFFQILEVIKYLQSHSIIHGDIKPQNLFWEENKKRVMLMDLDNLLYYDPSKESNLCHQVTPEYAPPEQFIYAYVDLTTDLFMLGTTCIKLLTGLSPRYFYYPHDQTYKKWDQFVLVSHTFKKIIQQMTVGKKRKYSSFDMLVPELKELQQTALFEDDEQKKDLLASIHRFLRFEGTQAEIESLGQEILAKRSSALTYYLVGEKLAQSHFLNSALKLFRLSIVADPYYVLTSWLMAQIHVDKDNITKAIEVLEQSLDYCDNDYYTYLFLGRLYFKVCWLKQAIAAYNKAIKQHPFFMISYLELGNLHLQTNNFVGAQEMCDQVFDLQPYEPRAWLLQCLIYGRQQHFDLAIEAGERALQFANSNFEIRYNLGVSYYGAGQFAKAIEQFKICLELNQNHIHSQYFMGSASLEVGYLKQAKYYLEKARLGNIEVELIDKKLKKLDQMQLAYNKLLEQRATG